MQVSEAMYPELKEAIGLVDGPVRKRKQLDQELLGAYNIGKHKAVSLLPVYNAGPASKSLKTEAAAVYTVLYYMHAVAIGDQKGISFVLT